MKKYNTGRQRALLCKRACQEKKALDIRLLDLRQQSSFTDYFVICSAQSDPQIKAIAEEVEREMRETAEIKAIGREGGPSSKWAVVDFGDVVVHIFHEQAREHYRLEELWNDAKQV